ncbi:MAG: hypothetical protein V2A74_11865 [bacterium]
MMSPKRNFTLIAMLTLLFFCAAARSQNPVLPQPEKLGEGWLLRLDTFCLITYPPAEAQLLASQLQSDLDFTAGVFRKHIPDLPWPTPTLELFNTPEEFFAAVDGQPEHVVAVAIPARRRILVNLNLYLSQHPVERQQTLVHELTHLLLGEASTKSLPRWLDEGLAMHAAGETDFAGGWELFTARLMRRTIPLKHLETSFPSDKNLFALAYRESFSATSFYLQRQYEREGAWGAIGDLLLLRDQERLRERFWDAQFRDNLERLWLRSESGLGRWLTFLTDWSVLWLVITALFLVAYWRIRKRKKRYDAQDAIEAESGSSGPALDQWTPEDDEDDEPW